MKQFKMGSLLLLFTSILNFQIITFIFPPSCSSITNSDSAHLEGEGGRLSESEVLGSSSLSAAPSNSDMDPQTGAQSGDPTEKSGPISHSDLCSELHCF